MQKNSELFFNLILLPIDFLAVVGSFVLAYIIRVKIDARPVTNPLGIILFVKIFLVIVPVWMLIFALSGLYNLSGLRGRANELGKIFVAVSGGTMFLILIDFASKQPIFPAKAVPIYGYLISLLLVVTGRQLVRGAQRSLFSFGIGLHQALVVGSGPIAQRIVDDLKETRKSGYQLVAAIDNAKGAKKRLPGLPIYDSLEQFTQSGLAGNLNEIIQADSALESEEILEMVTYASNNHLIYRFVPNQFGVYATNSVMGTLAGLPVVAIKQTPLEGWGRIVKRAFDIVGALSGLMVVAPIFLAVGILMKLTDPGPILYRHRRLSRIGRPFYIYKFRSMLFKYCDGTGYPAKSAEEVFGKLGQPELFEEFKVEQKLVRDPRVSGLGAWLRRTSLDELPQLINVLVGDLSLVGPRPVTEGELERYGSGSAIFLALKPGVTGLWQTSGRSDIGYDERIKLDIYYVENWSLWMDLRILIRTAVMLAAGKGAY